MLCTETFPLSLAVDSKSATGTSPEAVPLSFRGSALGLSSDLFAVQARRRSHEAAGYNGQEEQKHDSADGRGLLQAMTAGFAQELAALREGLAYISDPGNRHASFLNCLELAYSMTLLELQF